MKDKEPEFPSNSTLSCISILCGTNNVDHNSPKEIKSRLTSSGISVQTQCHHAKVVIIPPLPRFKKFSLRRTKINIIHSLWDSECPKYTLYT